MYAGHKYRNTLCSLEIERRTKVADLLTKLCGDVATAESIVLELEQQIEDAYKQIDSRSKRVPVELRDRVATLKAQLRDARQRLKSTKYEAYQRPDVVTAQAEVSAWHRDAVKTARANSGCYWGTYLLAEEAMSRSHIGAPPRFKSWTGDGMLGVQLQGGLTVADCLSGTDTRLQLVIDDTSHTKGFAKGKRRAVCRFRIGTEEDRRTPIFAEFTTFVHRPLPSTGVIKTAKLVRRNIGSQNHWELQLTVDDSHESVPSVGATGIVAVHAGWRSLENGSIQVATWCGSDGQSGILTISEREITAGDVTDGLRSTRDHAFNNAKADLRTWLDATEDNSAELPEWLTEETRFLHAWKSPKRLVALVKRWTKKRFDGDDKIYNHIEAWRKQDKHLWLWEAHQRHKTRIRVRDSYRKLAAELSIRYLHSATVKIDAKTLLAKPDVSDDEEDVGSNVRRKGYTASPGMLLETIRKKFGERDIAVDGNGISTTCCKCGGTANGWPTVTCDTCRSTIDVDRNACMIQLARAKVAIEQRQSLATDTQSDVTTETKTSDVVANGVKNGTARTTRRNRKKPKELRS